VFCQVQAHVFRGRDEGRDPFKIDRVGRLPKVFKRVGKEKGNGGVYDMPVEMNNGSLILGMVFQ